MEVDDAAFRLPLQVAHWRPISQMAQAQPVVHHGKESGLTRMRIAALTVWQAIYTQDFGGGPPSVRCLGGLFVSMTAISSEGI